MRSDVEFSGVLLEPFLIGHESIATTPDLSVLNLGIGDWWYGEIVDSQCTQVIKVTNTSKGLVIEQGACDSMTCDVDAGACIDTYCCGSVCDALEAEKEKCCIEEITSSDLDVVVDEEDCSKLDINIKDGVIPDVPSFCFLQDGNLVVDIAGNSIIFFCENGEKYGIKFSDLCTALAACAGGGDVTINETINNLDVSSFNANYGGMVIENGVIQTSPTDWYNNLATETEVASLIAAITTGVLSVDTGNAITDTGTATNPDLDLVDIHGSAQSGLSGNIQFDKYGRVTSVTNTAPWGDALNAGSLISILGSTISHDTPTTQSSTLQNGTIIDSFGHVVGENNQFKVSRWAGNPSGFSEDKAVNISAVNNGATIDFTFSSAMPDANYFISATDVTGKSVDLAMSNRTATGFSIPVNIGQISLLVVS